MYKSKWLKYDIIILIGIILIIGTHLVTNIIIMQQVNLTAADYNNIVKVFEANPLAKWALQIEQFKAIFSFVIIPSFIGALYYIVRRGGNEDYIAFTSLLFFLVGLFNIMNDLGVLIGVII